MFSLFKRRLYGYLLVYALIMGAVTFVLYSRHQTLTNSYIASNVREFDHRIESYESMQQKMIDNYYRLFLRSPGISEIMAQAAAADSAQQEFWRAQLMKRTGTLFSTLQEYDVNILFFHLPNSIAFLRVHEPQKFGDSLAEARPLIVHAQKVKRKVFAFETGKLWDGFRTVYPLFHQEEFVGTVEIAYSFLALKKQAMQQKPGAYTLLINRSVQEAKAKTDDIRRHYQQLLFTEEYLEDTEGALLRDAKGFKRGEIEALIASNKTRIREALHQGKLQGVKLYYNGEYSLLILRPVFEFNGKQAAYMVELTPGHTFLVEREREFALLWLSIAVLAALLLWYVYRYHRSTIFLEQYRDAIEKTMIVSRTDPKGIITYVNDRFTQVSGYSEKELIGKSHNIIRHPDTPAVLFKELWATIKAGKLWRGELKNRTKNGDAYYVKSTIYPLADENGEIVEYIGLREDITELVESAKKIEDEKRRFDTIFQHQNSIVVFARKEGGIEMVNRRFFDYFDFPDLPGFLASHRCICEMFIDRDGYLAGATFAEFLHQLEASSEEYRKVLVRDKSGRERILAVEYAPISLTDGEYIIFSYHDITELDETLHREEQLRVQAERSEAAKMEFLANMSHEIRTPLNGIMGFAKLLENADLAEEHRRQVKIISEQSKTLLGIINDILDLSKIESGHFELEKVLVNPFTEFETAFSLYSPLAHEKGIEYRVYLDRLISECIGIDSLRIKQVMGNLISNALKFTPSGGKIDVRVELLDRSHKPDKLRFSVTDTGIGIAPEKLTSIFSPFMQEDSSTTRRFGGTGLGLSISSKLVSLFGGELHVESTKGEGSRFWFDITVMECDPDSVRAMQSEEANASAALSLGHSVWAGIRVLVAEDHDVNRMLIEALLRIHGIEPDFAVNGIEAVEKVRSNPYHLVLMDVNMPGIDGLEATRQIRDADIQIPIIALTANALAGDRERFMEAGMDEHLTKPLDADRLERMLEMFLGKPLQQEKIIQMQSLQDKDLYADATARLKLPREIVMKLFDAFCSSMSNRLAVLEEAVSKSDFPTMESQAHAIKGAAANLYIEPIRDLAFEVEQGARDNAPIDYAMITSKMRSEAEKIRASHERSAISIGI